ncbi:MAG: hypothetical protein HY976_04200 [Candidatus Kerfeldbacteria bacterium]|nr:hypothetical protein [Candidatus Kerfeldbacteria bacterium]
MFNFKKHLGLLALIAVVAGVVSFPVPAAAARASLYLSPSSKGVTIGETFTVGLYVSSDVYVNAAESTVTFPTNLLTATGVTANGVFTLCAQAPSYSNSTGRVTFTCGAPTPGYKGTAGRVITMTFRAKATGSAKLQIVGGEVTANDGNGTNVLQSRGSGTYTISTASTPPPPPPPAPSLSAPVVRSDNQADPNKWYNNRQIQATWSGGSGVRGYSQVYDNNPATVPPETVNTTATSFSKADAPDGVTYLHVRAKYDAGWSSTTHFRFQIDATAPEKFTITIIGDPQLNFNTSDATSGVDHYELSLDGGAFGTVTSPYQTPDLEVGTHTVTVKAFDKAGNVTEASATFEVTGYPQPIIIDLTPVLRGEQPMIIRGFSNAQDTLRLTIGGDDYGPYKVSENIDPNPPSPAPEGKVAWKLELTPRLPNGQYEVSVVAVSPEGKVSSGTPGIKFRIDPPAIRVFGWLIPLVMLVNVLLIVTAALLVVAGYFAWRFFRLRRQVKSGAVAAKSKHQDKKKGDDEAPKSKFGPPNLDI